MTLDELRAALEVAKHSARVDTTEAALRNFMDWAEDVQQFLELVHGESLAAKIEASCATCEGHGHVPETLEPAQVWTACLTCGGRGKVQQPPKPNYVYPVLTKEQADAQKKCL